MDTISKKRRSEIMASIRSRNTTPELAVRKLIWGLGFRYRLHSRAVPGKPDIVLRKHKKAIFVHGCFWHQHKRCPDGRKPKSSQSYWLPKLERNVARDRAAQKELRRLGWKTLTLWECEIGKNMRLLGRISRFLSNKSAANRPVNRGQT